MTHFLFVQGFRRVDGGKLHFKCIDCSNRPSDIVLVGGAHLLLCQQVTGAGCFLWGGRSVMLPYGRFSGGGL